MKELKGVGYYIGLCSLKDQVDGPIEISNLEAIGFEDCEKTYVGSHGEDDIKLILPIKQADVRFNEDKVDLVAHFTPHKMLGEEEKRDIDVILVFKVEGNIIENIAVMDSRGEIIHKKDQQTHIIDCELDRHLIEGGNKNGE